MKYFVYNILLDFSVQPNSDIYTAFYDHTMYIDIPDEIKGEEELEEYIQQYIVENLEVSFDTPDEPYYETSYADFSYRKEEE
jgi:6-pyruvoyl-tetrahydropterin synthase